MFGTFGALLGKEWKEFLQHDAGKRGSASRLLLLAVFGVLMAWQLGPAFGAAWYTVAIVSLVSVLAIVQLVPDAFAGERERHTLDTLLATPVADATILLAKVAAAVSYGLAFAGVIATAAVVAEVVRFHGAVHLRGTVLATALGIAAEVTTLVAAAGVLISLRSSTVKQATQRLGLLFITCALPTMLPGHFVPAALRVRIANVASGGVGHVLLWMALLLALADVFLLGASLAMFNRPRLLAP